jgi:hypothetical protein
MKVFLTLSIMASICKCTDMKYNELVEKEVLFHMHKTQDLNYIIILICPDF